MKKFISILAALTVICGSTMTAPICAADEAAVAEEVQDEREYDFSSPDSIAEEDNMKFELFDGYAALTRVYDEDIEEFTVPETVNGLPVVAMTDGPFRNCKNLKKITLSKNIAVFDWADIAEEGIAEIAVAEGNPFYTVAGGMLYTKDMKELVCCPNGLGITEVTIPENTERIGQFAFVCCRELEKVTMGSNITSIGACAFWGCSGLTDIALPDTIKKLESHTFAGCSSLESIDIPDSVVAIDDDVFIDSGCIEIEGGVHYVDNWAVGSDKDIVTAEIREGTVGTASLVFLSRNKLKSITVPKSVRYMGIYFALGIFMPLEKVEFYNSVIPERCIGCRSVRDVYVYDPECNIADATNSIPAKWSEFNAEDVTDDEDMQIEYVLGHRTVGGSSSGSHTVVGAVAGTLQELDDDDSDPEISQKVNDYMDSLKPTVYSAPDVIEAPKQRTVIHGYKGSTAEAYAEKYEREFVAFEAEKPCQNGDLTGDGMVNVADIVILSRYLHGTYKFTEEQFSSADINGDGVADVFDLIAFRQMLLEILS